MFLTQWPFPRALLPRIQQSWGFSLTNEIVPITFPLLVPPAPTFPGCRADNSHVLPRQASCVAGVNQQWEVIGVCWLGEAKFVIYYAALHVCNQDKPHYMTIR